jgi:hypothetical protein
VNLRRIATDEASGDLQALAENPDFRNCGYSNTKALVVSERRALPVS